MRKNFRKGKCVAWVTVKTKGEVNIMSYMCRGGGKKRNNTGLEQGVVEIQTKLDTHKMKQED